MIKISDSLIFCHSQLIQSSYKRNKTKKKGNDKSKILFAQVILTRKTSFRTQLPHKLKKQNISQLSLVNNDDHSILELFHFRSPQKNCANKQTKMSSAKLRIGGSWSGILEVDLDEWTVSMLKEEVAKRSDCVGPDCINLICSGRVLRDGTEKLGQLGVKNNSKILASKVLVNVQDGKSVKDEFLAEEERAKMLSRLRTAATSLASRHASGSLPVEDFNLELENQSGEKVQLGSETDQSAIMMGLMLHANAKSLIKRQQYKDALEVLVMGEEAFSLCDSKLIEMVDNVSILQIDMVWCYFMLRDISWLSVAGVRLEKARKGIERAHGKESSRLRVIQGDRHPELALHLRMELLEGIVAYHSGQLQKSRNALTSAQARYAQLQVPDETLSLLMSLGYKEHKAKRALRMNKLDVASAVDFLEDEKMKREKKREENLQRQQEILEQKKYGVTPLKKAVDIPKLNYLHSIGFEKDLVAEALRRNENDTQKALDDLTNPEINSALQNHIISRRRKQLRQASSAAIENLMSMGFPKAVVVQALHRFGGEEQALNHLLSQVNKNHTNGLADQNAASGEGPSSVYTEEGDVKKEDELTEELPDPHPNEGLPAAQNAASGEGPSSVYTDERDVEMEDELTDELQNADAYSDYDIEVTKEGEAINEYLAYLNSAEMV